MQAQRRAGINGTAASVQMDRGFFIYSRIISVTQCNGNEALNPKGGDSRSFFYN